VAKLPAKIATRVAAALKKFQPILDEARKRDVNESDTVTLVVDILHELLGYDKYGEITSEHAIRGTYCDLAIKLEGKLTVLLEIKAIGLDLRDNHIKQAVDYAANQGCDWVVLTNGVFWQVYQVSFGKPIDAELILDLNLLELSHKRGEDVQLLALLSREAWQKSRLDAYAVQKHVLSRFTVAAILTSDGCISFVRRELKRLSKDVRVDADEVRRLLSQEVIKRETIEGEKADAARKLVNRSGKRALRAKPTKGEPQEAKPLPSPGTSSA
jgi:predicted type IV restriction endonuclease